MKCTKAILIIFLLGLQVHLHAQFQFGFRAGLNYSSVDEPSELHPMEGTTLESYQNSRGFHLGMSFGYEFYDFLGVRGEFLYNQKGYQYLYQGPAYQFLTSANGQSVLTTGDKVTVIENSNAYIDFPISFYVKPIQKLEISAGIGIGFLVSAYGNGVTNYNDISGNVADQSWELNYNYFRDEAGQGITTEENTFFVNGALINGLVSTGAYYDETELDGKYFNGININIHGALTYYLNNSVYLSGRYFYGLSDITNDNYSFIKAELDDNQARIPNPRDTRSLSTQISLGFYF